MTIPAALLGLFGLFGVFAIASTPALAQHTHGITPHAHGQSAAVPSLTADEVRELRNGEGMGLARAAELNHFPGPKHILEFMSELDLGSAQIERIETIHGKMRAQAIAKGEDILKAELRLADLFASGQPTAAEVRRITERLGAMRGRLRAIHLLAHIESAHELTGEQIERYDRLRGYRR